MRTERTRASMLHVREIRAHARISLYRAPSDAASVRQEARHRRVPPGRRRVAERAPAVLPGLRQHHLELVTHRLPSLLYNGQGPAMQKLYPGRPGPNCAAQHCSFAAQSLFALQSFRAVMPVQVPGAVQRAPSAAV